MNILSFSQSGLGLPDREYYFEPSNEKEREKYLTHVAKMFEFSGESKGFAFLIR